MSILNQLAGLSAAEEFFEVLGVDFDPAVVRVARLHILRRMGQYLHDSDMAGLADDAVREMCRAHLEQAYQDFVASSPIKERLFKVHRDAVAPKPEPKKPFVPLGALTAPGGE